jgi:hypothetical protein
LRVHDVRVKTGTDEQRSALLLSGCVQMFSNRTRVVAQLTSVPQFEYPWSTAVTSRHPPKLLLL